MEKMKASKNKIVICLMVIFWIVLFAFPAMSGAEETWWGRADDYVVQNEELEPLMSSIGLMFTFLKPGKIGCSGCPDFKQSPLLGITYRRWLSKQGLSLELGLSHYKNSLAGGAVPGTSKSMFRAMPVSARLLLNSKIKRSFIFDRQLYLGFGVIYSKADLDASGTGVHYQISDSLDGHEFVAGIAFIDERRRNMYRIECRFLSLSSETPLGLQHVTEGGQAALDAIPPSQRRVMFDLSGPSITLALNHHF